MNNKITLELNTRNSHELMRFHVQNILLVSSLYDAFILEEDGRISHRIFENFMNLDLHYIPRVTQVSSAKEALNALSKGNYDLIITMPRLSDMTPLAFGKEAKKLIKDIPVILLTYAPVDVNLLIEIRKHDCIDKIFYWFGESKIFLAIIKYVEDMKNFESDLRFGINMILIVEDSPWYYSFFLPAIYSEILKQTRQIISDVGSEDQRLLRVRARPKILTAETYEEAIKLFEKYKSNIYGIISDVQYPKEGVLNAESGILFAEKVRAEMPDIPFLLQSSEERYREKAVACGVAFLNKNAKNMLNGLRKFVLNNFGFGDFIFTNESGIPIARAANLEEFARIIRKIPLDSIQYHGSRNHFSVWLKARTEFKLANDLKPKDLTDFENLEAVRFFLYSVIKTALRKKWSGIISDFGQNIFSEEISFTRLGSGSLGGKARGIAFMNSLIAKSKLNEQFENVEIKIPYSLALCTDVFDEFLVINNLREKALICDDDDEIIEDFIKGNLPDTIYQSLRTMLKVMDFPLAVRSSSLLEDSQALPFSGVYKTFMLPNNHQDFDVRCKQLFTTIKKVYASVFLSKAKKYVSRTNFRIEEEKMAVLIQQLVGENYDNIFYPVVSGVAQSVNFYPLANMRARDGVFKLALGLGRALEGKEWIYRFSPRDPGINPVYRDADKLFRKSQKYFYALDLGNDKTVENLDEGVNHIKCNLQKAEDDNVIEYVSSVYTRDGVIQDSHFVEGKKVITFSGLLKNKNFEFTEIVRKVLKVGHKSLGTPVEIEFAVIPRKKESVFYLLQLRPLISGHEFGDVMLEKVKGEDLFCESSEVMGNGIYSDIFDIVYVNPDTFSINDTQKIAGEIAEVNSQFSEIEKKYLLIGFGRWGTSDPLQGIPVSSKQISNASVIVEANLNGFKADASKGNHLFQWMVSQNTGYFHIQNNEDSYIDWDWLKQLKNVENITPHLKHVSLKGGPVLIKIDGRSSKGIVLKPTS